MTKWTHISTGFYIIGLSSMGKGKPHWIHDYSGSQIMCTKTLVSAKKLLYVLSKSTIDEWIDEDYTPTKL